MQDDRARCEAPGNADPDEMLTLLEAANERGLSKKALSRYVHDEADPLPSVKDDDGVYRVRRGDVDAYLDRHPSRGRSWKAEPDRRPELDSHPEKLYYTLADAAKEAGCSVSSVRAMTRRKPNPMPTTKNKDGYILVEQDTFWEYFEMLYESERRPAAVKAAPAAPDPAFAGYPELAVLQGTYHKPKAIADALGLPTDLVRSWTKGPAAVEHVQIGRRVFINKYKLPAFLEREESQADGYAFALQG